MPITGSISTYTAGTSSTHSWTHVANGDPLHVIISFYTTLVPSWMVDNIGVTVTFDGTPMTQIYRRNRTGNLKLIYRTVAPPAISGTVQVTITLYSLSMTGAGLNLTGFPADDDMYTFGESEGLYPSGHQPIARVASVAGAQIIDCVFFNNATNTLAPISGQTQLWNQQVGGGSGTDQRSAGALSTGVGAAGTINTVEWNFSGGKSDVWGSVAMSYTGFDPVVEDPPAVIGPLAWAHRNRRNPTDGELTRDTYSDHDMQCPAAWENGFKEGLVTRFGDAHRMASHTWTGDWQGATFTYALADIDRRFRQQLHSATDRFWIEDEIKMTTRANRQDFGLAYTVFVGPIIGLDLSEPLGIEVTLGDAISQVLLSDEHRIPWRKIGDGFLSALSAISDSLDREAPEAIIYGEHRRTPSDPASPHGFQYTPTYLGIEGGDHVWMVCGHACADLPDVLVWTPVEGGSPDEFTSDSMLGNAAWRIPHHNGEPAYEDRRSDTYGNDRRYTLIRAAVGDADADACVLGEKTLTVFVDGIEPVGDGTGAVITDRIQQYEHFLINYVANYGPNSYQSGAWLASPTRDIFGDAIPIVDSDSFDACSAIAAIRLPASGSPAFPSGYIGAAIIGANSGDRSSVRRWLADWNRSCGVQFGITHHGQMRVFMLNPTQAIKDAAPLFTDAYEILDRSFRPDPRWVEMVNRVPFRTDYEHVSGTWKTVDFAEAAGGVQDRDKVIEGDVREYPFAPGITMAYHLARLEVLVRQHPPIFITLDATIGPDAAGDSLGHLDLGDYIRYNHVDAISEERTDIRLAQIVGHVVRVGSRRVSVLAFDCDDLIDYDAAPEYDVLLNDTCAEAVTLTAALDTPEIYDIDTTDHQTDPSLGGSPPGWSGTLAYHAAWWKGTAPAGADKLLLTTIHSLYDTQMAVFTGSCGSLTEVDYNDNDGVLQTSVLDIAVTPGTDYFILVAGYGPNDGGSLTFSAQFYEV